MTQEEKDIVLHGAKFEMMNRCIDFNDGTVDREKMLNVMQRYAEMYHDNELSKLRQHDVIKNEVAVCKGKCEHGYKDEDGNELFCSIKKAN